MTQDEIIRMAREAGIEQHRTMPDMTINLIHFAALVAEAEREACAKVCDERVDWKNFEDEQTPMTCAAAIRELK